MEGQTKKFSCDLCKVELKDVSEYCKHALKCKSTTKKRTCSICEKEFSNRYFKEHIKNHDDPYRFKCEDCDERFNTAARLKDHNRKYHEEEENQYVCEQCQKSFKIYTDLKNHNYRHHKANRMMFKCGHCEYETDIRYSLQVHERQHTGDKPFECTDCCKSFKQKSHLNQHKNVHHPEVEPYPKPPEPKAPLRSANNDQYLQQDNPVDTNQIPAALPLDNSLYIDSFDWTSVINFDSY